MGGKGCMAKGGMHGERGHAWQRGACMAKGGMCGEGGHVWQRGACVAKGGVCGMHAPSLRDTASQFAAGMHPTGMHSCYWLKRSFGQGSIFTGVCDSVHRGGVPDFALIFLGGSSKFSGGGGILGGVFFWGGSSKFSGGRVFFWGGSSKFFGGGYFLGRVFQILL